MTLTTRAAAILAFLFLALHLPFLPQSLEDLDSVNFALGIRDFDVANHQPHPPGYPLWVAAARIVAKLTPGIPGALSVLALLFSAGGLFFFWLTVRELSTEGQSIWLVPLLAFSPPVWV